MSYVELTRVAQLPALALDHPPQSNELQAAEVVAPQLLFLGETATAQERARLRLCGLIDQEDNLLKATPLPSPQGIIENLMQMQFDFVFQDKLVPLSIKEVLRALTHKNCSVHIMNLQEVLGQSWVDEATGDTFKRELVPTQEIHIAILFQGSGVPLDLKLGKQFAIEALFSNMPLTYYLKVNEPQICYGLRPLLALPISRCMVKIEDLLWFHLNIKQIKESNLSEKEIFDLLYKNQIDKILFSNPGIYLRTQNELGTSLHIRLMPGTEDSSIVCHGPILDLQPWLEGKPMLFDGTVQALFDRHFNLLRFARPPHLAYQFFSYWLELTKGSQAVSSVDEKVFQEMVAALPVESICECLQLQLGDDADLNFAFLYNAIQALPETVDRQAIWSHFSFVLPQSPLLLAVRNAIQASTAYREMARSICAMIAFSSLGTTLEKRSQVRIVQHRDHFVTRMHRLQLPLSPQQAMEQLIRNFPSYLDDTNPLAQLQAFSSPLSIDQASPLMTQQQALRIDLVAILSICWEGCLHNNSLLRTYFQDWLIELLKKTKEVRTTPSLAKVILAETDPKRRERFCQQLAEALGITIEQTGLDFEENMILSLGSSSVSSGPQTAFDLWVQLHSEQKLKLEEPLIDRLKNRAPLLVLRKLRQGAFSPQSEMLLVQLTTASLPEPDRLQLQLELREFVREKTKIPFLNNLKKAMEQLFVLWIKGREQDSETYLLLLNFLAEKATPAIKRKMARYWLKETQKQNKAKLPLLQTLPLFLPEFELEKALRSDDVTRRKEGLTWLLEELEEGELAQDHSELVALSLAKLDPTQVMLADQISQLFCKLNDGPTGAILDNLVATTVPELWESGVKRVMDYKPQPDLVEAYQRVGIKLAASPSLPAFLAHLHSLLPKKYLEERLDFYFTQAEKPLSHELNSLLPTLPAVLQRPYYSRALDVFFRFLIDFSISDKLRASFQEMKMAIRQQHHLPEEKNNWGAEIDLRACCDGPAFFDTCTPASLFSLAFAHLCQKLDGKSVQTQQIEHRPKIASIEQELTARYPDISLNLKVQESEKQFSLGLLLLEKMTAFLPKEPLAQEMLFALHSHILQWMLHSHNSKSDQWMFHYAARYCHPPFLDQPNTDFFYLDRLLLTSLMGEHRDPSLHQLLCLLCNETPKYIPIVKSIKEQKKELDSLLESIWERPFLRSSYRCCHAIQIALEFFEEDDTLFPKWYNRFIDVWKIQSSNVQIGILNSIGFHFQNLPHKVLIPIHRRRWQEIADQTLIPSAFPFQWRYLHLVSRFCFPNKDRSDLQDKQIALLHLADDWQKELLAIASPDNLQSFFRFLCEFAGRQPKEKPFEIYTVKGYELCTQAIELLCKSLGNPATEAMAWDINLIQEFWHGAGNFFWLKEKTFSTFYQLTLKLAIAVKLHHTELPSAYCDFLKTCFLIRPPDRYLNAQEMQLRNSFLLKFIKLVCDGKSPQSKVLLSKAWNRPALQDLFRKDTVGLAEAIKLLFT